MPSMGRSDEAGRNQFKNIKMGARQNAPSKKSVGDILNKLSGNEKAGSGVEFVDGKKHNKMGKDEFLKLLTHQLKNQDPMDPMDQKKFSSQLAQFSSLEQLTAMNSKMDKLGTNDGDEQKFMAASFLGKRAVTAGTTVDLDGKTSSTTIPFYLPQNAHRVVLRLTDSKGQMVKQFDLENMGKGHNAISWNGIGVDGHPAGKGSYQIQVHAWDKDFMPFKGETKGSGVVTSVNFENGKTILTLDGKKRIFLRDVESFQVLGDNRTTGVAKQQVPKGNALAKYQQTQENQVGNNY